MLQPFPGGCGDEVLRQQARELLLDLARGLRQILQPLQLLLQRLMLGEYRADQAADFLCQQRQPRLPLLAAPQEFRLHRRQGFGHAGAFERDAQQLVPERCGIAEGQELHAHVAQSGQVFLQVFGLLLQLQHE